MVGVPESSGFSKRFHRESDEDAGKTKLEPGIEALAEGYTQNLTAGMNSDDAKEEGPDIGLEENPRPPHQAPSGALRIVTRVTVRRIKLGRHELKELLPLTPRRLHSELGKKKWKAPNSDAEDRDERPWTEEELAHIFHKKDLFAFLLEYPVIDRRAPRPDDPPTSRQLEAATQLLRTFKDTGIMPRALTTSASFDLETTVIHRSAMLLYNKLEPLVGLVALPETIKRTPVRSPDYQTGSSQYASTTSKAGSDTFSGSNAAGRQANVKPERSSCESTPVVTPVTIEDRPDQNAEGLEMAFVESFHESHGEYDTHNRSIDTPRQASHPQEQLQTDTYFLDDGAPDPNIRDLGTEGVKSAFVRDQAPDREKCLVLGELLTGPARNWYRQLN
ncbi:LOW QUALITY PROTEIN: hypothetical protein PHMEG_00014026 [Phytophthora megakarya]|uniref:Uncharacterized protein n=1 Tax=Phytophthora megakarya TaxID=4795 RepID=A0A225W4T8_9STRA|nr:LOW QUALITY PROTEIN: hypothetical protein PHMEG_00014026 [Phytophthora megakarya]